MSEIKDICEKLGIQKRRLNTEKYRDLKPHYDKILSVISHLNEDCKGELILYGGQTTHPKLLGYRKMRTASNDIDCIGDERCISKLSELNSKVNMFYYEPFDTVFIDYEGFPTSFVVNKLHDWEIPDDLRDSRIHRELNNSEIKLCPPEYTIMLKMRRAKEEGELYGKDKIDIPNLLLAPEHNEELNHVDLSKLSYLLEENVTEEEEQVSGWLNDIKGVETLTKEENRELEEKIEEFEKALDRQYRPIFPIQCSIGY